MYRIPFCSSQTALYSTEPFLGRSSPVPVVPSCSPCFASVSVLDTRRTYVLFCWQAAHWRIGAGLGSARFILPCASPQNAGRDSGPLASGARSRLRIARVPAPVALRSIAYFPCSTRMATGVFRGRPHRCNYSRPLAIARNLRNVPSEGRTSCGAPRSQSQRDFWCLATGFNPLRSPVQRSPVPKPNEQKNSPLRKTGAGCSL